VAADGDKPTTGLTAAATANSGHLAVLSLLIAAGSAGAVLARAGARALFVNALLDVAIVLFLAAGILVGVTTSSVMRRRPQGSPTEPADAPDATSAPPTIPVSGEQPPPEAVAGDASATPPVPGPSPARSQAVLIPFIERRWEAAVKAGAAWWASRGPLDNLRLALGIIGAVAVARSALTPTYIVVPIRSQGIVAIVVALVFAALAAAAANYFRGIDPVVLPEARSLTRASRALAWALGACTAAIAAAMFEAHGVATAIHFALTFTLAWVCFDLIVAPPAPSGIAPAFPVRAHAIDALGNRANALASLLDHLERRLGIDLRSTWALSVVRRSIEPLAVGLLLIGWLATSLTVVKVDEQALVERFGVPVPGPPLEPGLHLHFPWPADAVYRFPVRRVQAVRIGHESEANEVWGGPEDVIWSVLHAGNEFTLLLGDGRDLVTVDAAIQYLITDPRAWRYHAQNPIDALRVLGYRAVMWNTIDKSLSDVLSQNVAVLSGRMREMVQRGADSLNLGVRIVGFTVGGMHPPVAVAPAYEGVISAQIQAATQVGQAEAYRNRAIPEAELQAVLASATARAEGEQQRAEAVGAAWSFRTLETAYRIAPSEYMFRRRLETLEENLSRRPFTIVDARFLREGGQLWLTQ